MTTTATVERTIAKGNSAGTGFLTIEEPNKWFNLSRFASPAPTIPPTGTTARLTLDGKGYVRSIEPVSSQIPATIEDVPFLEMGASEPKGQLRAPTPRRTDGTEVRLRCLQAAAIFLADRPETNGLGVISLAEKWAQWATAS